jgi:hypothetical protein
MSAIVYKKPVRWSVLVCGSTMSVVCTFTHDHILVSNKWIGEENYGKFSYTNWELDWDDL